MTAPSVFKMAEPRVHDDASSFTTGDPTPQWRSDEVRPQELAMSAVDVMPPVSKQPCPERLV
jgi:hypothetical protein